MYMYASIYLQEVLSFTQKELDKQDSFSLFFNIVPVEIIALDPTMLMHCDPITEGGDILVFQKFLHCFHAGGNCGK